jgi:predicted nucleotidyltransferase
MASAGVLNRKQIIYRLREFMLDQPSVRFAYLYGSRALGFARPDSDVDVAAYFEPNGDVAPELSLEAELRRKLGLLVQVINLNERPADQFFRKVLPKALVIKDSPERVQWEQERGAVAGEDMGTREDYLAFALDTMSEKNGKLREALPLLDEIDLNQVKSGDMRLIQSFLGAFFLVFQPLGTIAHRMANFCHLTKQVPTPTDLKGQIRFLIEQLEIDPVAAEPLHKMTNIRNKVAHAYWNLTEQELTDSELHSACALLKDLIQRLDSFITSAREQMRATKSQVNNFS